MSFQDNQLVIKPLKIILITAMLMIIKINENKKHDDSSKEKSVFFCNFWDQISEYESYLAVISFP